MSATSCLADLLNLAGDRPDNKELTPDGTDNPFDERVSFRSATNQRCKEGVFAIA